MLLDRPEPALTDFAAGLRDASAPLEPIELVATAADGHPVHGWVVRPEGEGPHPVLLVIHGGPFARSGMRSSTRRRCTRPPGTRW